MSLRGRIRIRCASTLNYRKLGVLRLPDNSMLIANMAEALKIMEYDGGGGWGG